MIFDQFDRIFVVNLDARTDRRAEMQEQLALVGLSGDPRVQFFSAIKIEEPGPFARAGSHGAFLSHLAILRSQIGKGETILILQDDCNFLPCAETFTLGNDWDIFYGGYHQLDPGDLHLSGIQGAHCMAFRSTIIRPLVNFLEEVYDGSYSPPGYQIADDRERIAPPIDGAIVWFRRAHPRVCTVFHEISYQRSSRTDIGDLSFIDRLPGLARVLRRIKRCVLRIRMPG